MIKWVLDIILDTRDVFWRRLSGFQDVPGTIFRAHLLRYSGTTIALSDGIRVKWGDVFIGLHLNNRKLMRLLKRYQPMERRKMFLREVHRSLKDLVHFIDEKEHYHEATAIRARTILAYNFSHWPVDIFPLKRDAWFTRLYRWGLKVNLARYHPLRYRRLFSKNRRNLQIQDVWMSTASLRTFAQQFDEAQNQEE